MNKVRKWRFSKKYKAKDVLSLALFFGLTQEIARVESFATNDHVKVCAIPQLLVYKNPGVRTINRGERFTKLRSKANITGNGKRKRRRRKRKSNEDEKEEVDASSIKDVARFSFSDNGRAEDLDNMNDPSTPIERNKDIVSSTAIDVEEVQTSIPLPDIKDTLRRKDDKNKSYAKEPEGSKKKKIDRRDKEALLKLLEQDPYADADDSFFEQQEYTTVSALLGERAKLFLGLPTGPLQVGHFIGALVIVLMAFIDYPGFPLTNLPSPLRGALQGGLGSVYTINFVLTLLAILKAGERGQPALLWIGKVLTVGGLAFDQLTQLPTLDEMENRKR